MTWTNKHVNASVVSAFMTLQPVATVILSSIFLAYRVNAAQLGAGAIVILGLLATCYGQMREHIEDSDAESVSELEDDLMSADNKSHVQAGWSNRSAKNIKEKDELGQPFLLGED
mmetsp:Transcript_18499/g.35379  ORF Transcript_18499/g.35379 Transcript_18499/m.35379 type:complete len:115 (+) Transcript_18499:89-433(+)